MDLETPDVSTQISNHFRGSRGGNNTVRTEQDGSVSQKGGSAALLAGTNHGCTEEEERGRTPELIFFFF